MTWYFSYGLTGVEEREITFPLLGIYDFLSTQLSTPYPHVGELEDKEQKCCSLLMFLFLLPSPFPCARFIRKT